MKFVRTEISIRIKPGPRKKRFILRPRPFHIQISPEYIHEGDNAYEFRKIFSILDTTSGGFYLPVNKENIGYKNTVFLLSQRYFLQQFRDRISRQFNRYEITGQSREIFSVRCEIVTSNYHIKF